MYPRLPVTDQEMFVALRACINRGFCDPKQIPARTSMPLELILAALEQGHDMCLVDRNANGDYFLNSRGEYAVRLDSLQRMVALDLEHNWNIG